MTDTPTTQSLADSLRQSRERLTEEREPRLFELPGYGKDLQVKYRVLSRAEKKESMKLVFTQAQAREERAAEKGMCSTLAKACVGFYTERDGKVVPLNEAEGLGDELIRWGDARLVELFAMNKDEPRAREVIEYVLPDDDVLELHHNEVSGWMERVLGADDEDF